MNYRSCPGLAAIQVTVRLLITVGFRGEHVQGFVRWSLESLSIARNRFDRCDKLRPPFDCLLSLRNPHFCDPPYAQAYAGPGGGHVTPRGVALRIHREPNILTIKFVRFRWHALEVTDRV